MLSHDLIRERFGRRERLAIVRNTKCAARVTKSPGLGAATPGTSSLFGTAPTPVPAPAPAPGLQLAQATTLMPEKEIVSLAAALDPNSAQYRFRHIFYNKVENPAQRVRPPGVDETQWREALEEVGGEQNAENLWPVLGSGFGALAERLKCDKEAHDANAEQEALECRDVAWQHHDTARQTSVE